MRRLIQRSLLGAVLLAGCQDLNQKAHNTGNFIAGDTEYPLARSPAEVSRAARQAAEDADLVFISSDEKPTDDKGGKIQTIVCVRSHKDEKVTFTVIPDENGTKLKINSGMMGDPEMRHVLLDGVKRHLGIMAATQPETQKT